MFAELEKEAIEPESLATPRLILRRPVMTDVNALVSLANNPNIAENLASLPHPYSERDAQAWIERARRAWDKGWCAFSIHLNTPEPTLVGACGFGPVANADLPQLGYWIGEPYWGRGFATEAAQAVIDHIFSSSDHDEIGSACRVTNAASRRVTEKCGFQYDGLGMIHSQARGGTVPILKFRLDRKTWTSLKAWAAA